MDEIHVNDLVLAELGLSREPILDEVVISPETRLKSNLPAIPEHVPGANRLIADLVDLAAILDPNPDRDVARNAMRERLVRNEGGRMVHYASIEFEPEIQKNGDVHAVAWYSKFPGETTKVVKIVPLIYAGPEFLKQTENGSYISGGTFQCILFHPHKKNRPYKALPLGFADKKTIENWNDVATRRNALPVYRHDPWPTIQVIENELRRPGVRRIWFTPQFNLHQALVKGSSKRQLLGNHFGQKVYLSPKATIPEPDVKNGIKGFFEEHLFRAKKLTESSMEVVWLGKAKDVPIEDRITMDEVQNIMNPFAVLNTTPMEVDWKTIDESTRKWINRAYNDQNPLYLAALDLKLVKETDDMYQKRIQLIELWGEAVRLVRLEMIEAAKIGHRQLSIAPKKPSAKEIMGEQTNIETLLHYLNEPVDAAADWIGQVLNKSFDQKSPYHMHLRRWLINNFVKPHIQNRPQGEVSQIFPQIPELTPKYGTSTRIQPTSPSAVTETSLPSFQPSGTFQAIRPPTRDPEETILIDPDDVDDLTDSDDIGFPQTTSTSDQTEVRAWNPPPLPNPKATDVFGHKKT